MEHKKTSAFLRQRKFLMVIPLLALPFVTLGFWALGGGQYKETNAQQGKGFNKNLPGVNLKDDKARDKMSYYTQAAQDSAKLKELKKNDPYYRMDSSAEQINIDEERLGFNGASYLSQKTVQQYRGSSYNDPNEQKVYQKLDQLNAALAETPTVQKEDRYSSSSGAKTGASSREVERLEQMMLTMQQGVGEDPEMKQLDGMLEKIIDIQNPGLAQEKLRKASEEKRGRVFAVSTTKKPDAISSLDNEQITSPSVYEDNPARLNGFYSLDNVASAVTEQNAIEAVVHETQTIVNGSTVKLRLSNEIYINGQLIAQGSFITGIASLNGERLSIKINSVRFRNNLFPVELAVFDLDGLEGINIPGAISRDVAKESADRGLQNIGFNSFNPTLEMQAAGVGVEAAKSLFSKKAKLIRVTVKAGYAVLLMDEKQKQQH